MNRGNSYDDLGNSTAALADYDRAIAIKPNYALAYLNRGIAHERAGNRAKAIADLQLAAKLFKASGDLNKYQSALEMIRVVESEGKRK
jgi:tetratricopeptide (TPR) repeat protein